MIRSAMLTLRAEGLIEGHQGRDVYVRPQDNARWWAEPLGPER
ncbi:hypothetical protein V6U90_00935 [Micromonospora sp. CPCC 206060]